MNATSIVPTISKRFKLRHLEFDRSLVEPLDSSHRLKFHRQWLVKTVALTAGASAPECLVEEVVKYLATKGFANVKEVEVMPENVRFGLPPEIVEAIASAPAASTAAN